MREFVTLAAVFLLVGADDPQEAAKKEVAKLQGEWSMIAGEKDGRMAPKDFIQGAKRVCKDEELTVTVDDRVYMKAKIVIDPTKNPKAVDYIVTEGDHKGKTLLGIYQIDGDTVKFCFAPPDKDRPTDFAAGKGSGRTFSVWKQKSK
jgi:uncharacterized protein (TIGR03067 family)